MAATLRTQAIPLCDRDASDPARRSAELVQRGRMILDVSAADLEAAEAAYGPFHPTAWHFRNALNEARRSWDRLRAVHGGATLEAALEQPPLTFLVLGGDEQDEGANANVNASVSGNGGEPGRGRRARPTVVLIPIGGRTYRAQRVEGTALAPVQWRLTRLHPPLEDGPYYACRLRDGSTQCDCAEWTYQVADDAPGPRAGGRAHCKHLAALAALGWI